jgi:hypothetical protein
MKWISREATGAELMGGYAWAVESKNDDATPPVVCCLARNEPTADAIAAALNVVILGQGIHRLETLVRCAEMEANGDRRPAPVAPELH